MTESSDVRRAINGLPGSVQAPMNQVVDRLLASDLSQVALSRAFTQILDSIHSSMGQFFQRADWLMRLNEIARNAGLSAEQVAAVTQPLQQPPPRSITSRYVVGRPPVSAGSEGSAISVASVTAPPPERKTAAAGARQAPPSPPLSVRQATTTSAPPAEVKLPSAPRPPAVPARNLPPTQVRAAAAITPAEDPATLAQQCADRIDLKRSIFPAQRRVIAFGDLHGDFDALRVCLEDLAQVMRKSTRPGAGPREYDWIGGDTWVVQTGDYTDRFRGGFQEPPTEWGEYETPTDEYDIMMLLNRLNLQASAVGGRVIKLLGNHEYLNIDQAFQYVTPPLLQTRGEEFKKPSGRLFRALFGCGVYGIVQVGDWLFCHGGVIGTLVDAVAPLNEQHPLRHRRKVLVVARHQGLLDRIVGPSVVLVLSLCSEFFLVSRIEHVHLFCCRTYS